jgi:hypothetical protein
MTEPAVKQRVIGKPFQKGTTGNPNGRPAKIHCVTSLLAELLNGDPEKVKAKWVKGKPTGAMIVALAMFAKMGRGDLTAIKEGLDRVEGKVKDLVDMTSNGGSIGHTTIVVESPEAKQVIKALMKGE